MLLTRLSTTTAAWLLAILLVVTFALGALLTVTMQERNRIEQSLKDTKEDLKEQKHENEVEKANTAGCMAQIGQLNQGIADQALAQLNSAKAADTRASDTLAQLPSLIKKDQVAEASPAVATIWLKELFQ